ncbi:CDP-alcohol phosphatidyltransferase family protein [Natronocalculus amylovorans]|uniref:CDP-alcohol phosphatidyltransferase family protein n=1 Tax=Natronocalculus amylovorans TaxID=2917812 RepID=A0AAE3FZF1_9EURY|nr:CDP-alcohol phosphatidyltransferase family protein [Natronocalculus amylovorans]MCL9817956.1 CDP-alcohol phosphatidyltransferase family protein [Natronocalculus amylovorans]
MTLDQLRDVSDRAIVPFVSVATKLGLSPNAISTLALIVAIAAGIALALAGENTQLYFIAGLLVLFNGFLDVLDGAVARETDTTSKAGDYLDHLIDRYADVLILGGLTVGAQQYELGLLAITGVLLTAYLGTQAQAVGLGRMYGGLLGRADILMLVGIVALLAPWVTRELYGLTIVGLLLAFFAVVSHVTALQRFVWSWKQLRKLDE